MPELIQGMLESLGRGIDQVPPAIRAIILLGSPTVAWVIARVMMGPRRRVAEYDADTSWVCAECLSINQPRQRRCYRCRAENPAELVEVDQAGRPTPVDYPDDGDEAWAAEYDAEDDVEYEDDEDDEEDEDADAYEGDYEEGEEEYEDDEDDDDEAEVGVAVGPDRWGSRQPVGVPIEAEEPVVVSGERTPRRRDSH